MRYEFFFFADAVCFVYLVRSDGVCLVVALGVKMLSWFDLLLLLCTDHTRTPWLAQTRELGARLPLYRCYCTAVYVPGTDFVAARVSGSFRLK